MIVKYLFQILLIILCYESTICSKSDITHYCGYWPCRNRTHVLCNLDHTSGNVDQEFRRAILDPINTFRANLRDSQKICNLRDFEWNGMLESLAVGAVVRENFNEYCFANDVYKYVLNFNLTTINSNVDVTTQIYDIINSSDKPSWLYSAYSSGIGCAINYTRKYVVCMINGVELIHSDQSFGYNDECGGTITKLDNIQCEQEDLKCDNHLICTSFPNFNSANFQNMPYTTRKFILHKFWHQNENIKWDDKLEYLAKQLVKQKLTNNDKCMAMKLYPNMMEYLFEGTNRYDEHLSNIDNLWQTNNVTQNVGCAMYTRKTEDSWNTQWNTYLYCLYGYNVPIIDMSWTYFIIFAVIVVICVILVSLAVLLLLFNIKKGESVEQPQPDYYDMIDVR